LLGAGFCAKNSLTGRGELRGPRGQVGPLQEEGKGVGFGPGAHGGNKAPSKKKKVATGLQACQ